MSTEIQKSPGQRFLDGVFTADRMELVQSACEGNRYASPEKIKATIAEACMRNTDLFQCSPISVFTSCMLAARLDLDASGHHNGAAFIARWAGRDKPKECTVQLGYGALVDLATRDGRIRSFTVDAVYAADSIEFQKGTNQYIRHTPVDTREEGELPVWFYAIARYPDGGYEFEIMSRQEVEGIRDKFATNTKGEVKSPAWRFSFAEMGKKTVLRRLIKRLPVNPVLAEAIHEGDLADGYSFDPRRMRAAHEPAPLNDKLLGEGEQAIEEVIEMEIEEPELVPADHDMLGKQPEPADEPPARSDDGFATDMVEYIEEQARKKGAK